MADEGKSEPEAPSSAPEGPSIARGGASRRQLGIAVAASLALLGPLVIATDRAAHGDEVLRGVTVAGHGLAGQNRDEATLIVRDIATRLEERRAPVSVRSETFELDPRDVSFAVDVDATVEAAMGTGRAGGVVEQALGWTRRLFEDEDVHVRGALDRAALETVLVRWEKDAIADPPFDGTVVLKGDALEPDYPRPGSAIEREGAARAILSVLGLERGSAASLPVGEAEPRRTRAVIDAAVTEARALVAAPVQLSVERAETARRDDEEARERHAATLTLSADRTRLVVVPVVGDSDGMDGSAGGALKGSAGGGVKAGDAGAEPLPGVAGSVIVSWSAVALARGLRAGPGADPSARPALSFDAAAIGEELDGVRAALESPPENARIVIDDRDEVTIVPSRSGTRLDAGEIAGAVLTAARSEGRSGTLPLARAEEPTFTTEDARSLGLTGLVSTFTTRHPCCQPRVKNIHRIADLLDGRIVRPGETFSTNEAVGPRTAQNGFFAAPSIEDGEMVDTVGGGVSQFATTLFNAVFYAGYDIVERQAHSYWFPRYPMGHEATLSWPKPDLVFRDDTAAAMLIRTSYTEKSITVKLYGDNGGRKIEAKVSPRQDVVDPPLELIASDELMPDASKVKDRGVPGWSVIVARILTLPDGTKREERRKVTYKPRPRRVEVHACHIPPGKEGHTGEPCPEMEDAGVGGGGSEGEEEPDAL